MYCIAIILHNKRYWVMYPVISSYLYHKKQAILRKAWNKHRFFISLY